MKLSRFSLQSLAFTDVLSRALRMPLRSGRFAKGQIHGVIVLLAVNALAPVRVSAGVHRSLPSFKQEVVGTVGAHNKVARSVIGSDVVDVVDLFFTAQIPTESTFSHEDMLEDVSLRIGVWMAGSTFLNISVAIADDPALPIRIFLQRHSCSVPFAYEQKLTFADAVTASVPSPCSNWCWESATTPTKTRRINQSRAPNVCADSTINLTHSGRLS